MDIFPLDPMGRYSNGLHYFLMRELEMGARVTMEEEDEALGFGPLFDIQAKMYFDSLSGSSNG